MRISDWSSDVCSSDLLSCMRGAFPAGHVSASTLSGELTVSQRVPSHGLEKQGFATGAAIHWNLTAAPLIALAVKRGEGLLSKEGPLRSEEHTSELQSLMRTSSAVFCLNKKTRAQ